MAHKHNVQSKPELIISPAEWEPIPDGVIAPDIIRSSLACEVRQGDLSVAIAIYRHASEQEWIVMIQNDHDGAYHWDDPFPTEQAALDAALQAIKEDGIERYAGNPCDCDFWNHLHDSDTET